MNGGYFHYTNVNKFLKNLLLWNCWSDFEIISWKCSLSDPFNPFPNKPWFLRVCSICLLKTLREKEKLLVTSNFSFSHSVFYPFGKLSIIFIKLKIVVCKLFQFERVYNLSFGKGLKNCSQNSDRAISPFPTVFSIHLENFPSFSSNLKLSSANSFNLKECTICRLGKG